MTNTSYNDTRSEKEIKRRKYKKKSVENFITVLFYLFCN